MSNDTIRCVSLTNGALSPDQRVNYEFGLVLGVNEFRQEQRYLLEKDYLHNRSLHGYGTVDGLQVRADRPAANGSEVLITVDRGVGIDQFGRGFSLRDAQCAYLGAWLGRQEQAQPGIIQAQAQKDPSGILHAYVVARYDECLDALVPIPGQPCSSSDVTQAPSRITDAFRMELRWDPPEMPAWVAVQRFARLMAAVRIDTGLSPAQSDEDAITSFVRTLDQPGPFDLPGFPGFGSPPQPFLRLPAETAHEALDRIFTVWVTEVRPRLAPDLIDPTTPLAGQALDPAILLARIDFVAPTPFDASHPAVDAFNPPDDTGRPYLLHTQLIQELLALGGEGAMQQDVAELVTFGTQMVANRPHLGLWFHTDQPVRLPAQINVLRGLSGSPAPFTATAAGGSAPFSFLWDLVPASGPDLDDRELLSFAFDTTQIEVGSAGVTLASVMAGQGLNFLGFDGWNTVFAYHLVDLPPTVTPGPTIDEIIKRVMQIPTEPFVTITPPIRVSPETMVFEMWFHVDQTPDRDENRIPGLKANSEVVVFGEEEGPPTPEQIKIASIVPQPRPGSPPPPPQHNVFNLQLDAQSWAKNSPRFLRFVFDLRLPVVVGGSQMRLGDWIDKSGIKYDGFMGKNIVVYVRLPGQGG